MVRETDMLERKYWRAIYDEERKSFVVDEAGWIDGDPAIEYCFSFFGGDETSHQFGGLEKCWLDEHNLVTGEFFTFGDYATEEAFQTDVEQILVEARDRSKSENLDHFLAVIDVVKEHAVHAELEDDDIFLCEGLFEDGPEDAYTLRDGIINDSRLHDHVERSKDECWRLHTAHVVDAENNTLGWALVVLLYPALTSKATEEDVQSTSRAELLEIDHWHDKSAAGLALDMTYRFMTQGGRLEDPDLAFSNDSEVFEFLSVQMSHEEIPTPEWEVLEGDALGTFINGERALVRDNSRWHPHKTDLVTRYAMETGLSPHFADQLHAYLLDNLQLTEKFDENSPWRFLDEEE
jgi:hypothetical protein